MSSFTKTIDSLVKVLKSENNCAIDCFDKNKIIVYPGKSQTILLDKRKTDFTNKNLKIRIQNIQVHL